MPRQIGETSLAIPNIEYTVSRSPRITYSAPDAPIANQVRRPGKRRSSAAYKTRSAGGMVIVVECHRLSLRCRVRIRLLSGFDGVLQAFLLFHHFGAATIN